MSDYVTLSFIPLRLCIGFLQLHPGVSKSHSWEFCASHEWTHVMQIKMMAPLQHSFMLCS